MFDVPAQVLVQLGLQLAQLLLCLPHVLLQLQAGLPGVVVAACQSPAVAHLVAWERHGRHSLETEGEFHGLERRSQMKRNMVQMNATTFIRLIHSWI